MNFHLNYNPPISAAKISHLQTIFMMGSCFAENIGQYLNNYKFKCEINPNGILFNPISLSSALHSYLINSTEYSIVKNNDLFFSLNHHGVFGFKHEEELVNEIKASQQKANSHIKKSDWLIITFGSAFVYRYIKTGHIAANCHKIPASEFTKELLKPEGIVATYKILISDLKKNNPSLNILFTVSPVKYLRDGLVENNLSKSILIQSVHEIINSNENCFYFPAYELVNDDLRDYRFYKEDLAHPNKQALKYVWEKFSETYFSSDTKKINERINEIVQAAHHRPLKEFSNNHNEFKKGYLIKCTELEKEFEFLDFSEEKLKFQ